MGVKCFCDKCDREITSKTIVNANFKLEIREQIFQNKEDLEIIRYDLNKQYDFCRNCFNLIMKRTEELK